MAKQLTETEVTDVCDVDRTVVVPIRDDGGDVASPG